MPTQRDALAMVGESYPFFKESWLDLRIKGSQLSQYFRRKCKNTPKGLFAYPAAANGLRYSMHWISEAHRNSWHVLLDATGLVMGEERLALAMHRPDFVVCGLENNGGGGGQGNGQKVSCLLVRKNSFDTSAASG
ncbi:unnamed protein product [Linum tenue]|uniref:Molybdenum cofactor sulfurase n=1 Tax=Linum tenue TaxID=586396 RepID=A0AAV0S6B0_9ROSI|nr:unnamed protein product [Linum tenue]